MSSVFVRPGRSRHTSGPTKGGSSPVEEASGNSSFFISESTRTLSGLSAHDERLLRQRGAHCSLPLRAPSAGRIKKGSILGWPGHGSSRKRGRNAVETPPRSRRPPQSSANELLSQPRAARSHHAAAAAVARHLPDSGDAIRSSGSTPTAGIL